MADRLRVNKLARLGDSGARARRVAVSGQGKAGEGFSAAESMSQPQAAARGAGSAEPAGLTGAFGAAPPDAPAANLQPGPRDVDADKRVYEVKELLALKDDHTEFPAELKLSFKIVDLPEGKPPSAGFVCDICKKPGGTEDSHWKKFCPRIREPGFDPSKHFERPDVGYVGKYCHRGGGEQDSQ